MTLLLDTCTFLWLLSDDPRLPLRARTECRAPSNAVYLSALSVWEITIKYRLGRLPLPESPELFVAGQPARRMTRTRGWPSSPWQKGLFVNRGSCVRIDLSPVSPTTNPAHLGPPGPRIASNARRARPGG